MAHEVETMAYVNQVPWHGLGHKIEGKVSSDEFLKLAGLDWEVLQEPCYIDVDGEKIETGKYALVRETDNRIFTHTSARWTPVQNKEILDFMDHYVTAGGAELETAGSLHGGKVIWALANLGRGFNVSPGDKVNGYLLLTSNHEVGTTTQVHSTTVRVVCNNTMTLAHNQSPQVYKQDHRSAFDPEAARDAIGLTIETLAAAESRWKTLNKLQLSADDAMKKVLLPLYSMQTLADEEFMATDPGEEQMPKQIREIMASINNAPGAVPGTAWGVLNGITHWSDHVAGNNGDSRLYRSWIGGRRDLKIKAEQTLFELAS